MCVGLGPLRGGLWRAKCRTSDKRLPMTAHARRQGVWLRLIILAVLQW